MKLADVRFDWVPSVSEDVVSVKFVLASLDSAVGELLNVSLDLDATSYVVEGLEEKSRYLASVIVSDGVSEAVANVEVVIPDLSAPAAVTGLMYTIVNTYDPMPEPEGE